MWQSNNNNKDKNVIHVKQKSLTPWTFFPASAHTERAAFYDSTSVPHFFFFWITGLYFSVLAFAFAFFFITSF